MKSLYKTIYIAELITVLALNGVGIAYAHAKIYTLTTFLSKCGEIFQFFTALL